VIFDGQREEQLHVCIAKAQEIVFGLLLIPILDPHNPDKSTFMDLPILKIPPDFDAVEPTLANIDVIYRPEMDWNQDYTIDFTLQVITGKMTTTIETRLASTFNESMWRLSMEIHSVVKRLALVYQSDEVFAFLNTNDLNFPNLLMLDDKTI
jgi:hypothetical protein